MNPRRALLLPLLLAGCSSTSPGLYERLDAACGALLADGQQQATAFLVSEEGWVLTAAHAAAGGAALSWDSPALGTLPLERVAADPSSDLALLRLPAPSRPYPFLRVAAADPPPGAAVFNFGNPVLRRRLLLGGETASAASAFEFLPDLAVFTECRHLAASTLPGMSGGPWVDARGEVVGVQSGGVSLNGAIHGVAWMSPRERVLRLLREGRGPEVGDLGCVMDSLYEASPAERRAFPPDARGALLRRLLDGSPLAAAGAAPGWLVEAVDGVLLPDRDALLRAARAVAPGAELTLRLRPPGGEAREARVRAGRLRPFARPAFAP